MTIIETFFSREKDPQFYQFDFTVGNVLYFIIHITGSSTKTPHTLVKFFIKFIIKLFCKVEYLQDIQIISSGVNSVCCSRNKALNLG